MTHTLFFTIEGSNIRYSLGGNSKNDMLQIMLDQYDRSGVSIEGAQYFYDRIPTTANEKKIRKAVRSGRFHRISYPDPSGSGTIERKLHGKYNLIYQMWNDYLDEDVDINLVPFYLDGEKIIADAALMHYNYAHGRLSDHDMLEYMRKESAA